jgi:hypothetical protein
MMAVDTFINGNGDWFCRFKAEDKPQMEVGDFLASHDPQPDEEEYWGMTQ